MFGGYDTRVAEFSTANSLQKHNAVRFFFKDPAANVLGLRFWLDSVLALQFFFVCLFFGFLEQQ